MNVYIAVSDGDRRQLIVDGPLDLFDRLLFSIFHTEEPQRALSEPGDEPTTPRQPGNGRAGVSHEPH